MTNRWRISLRTTVAIVCALMMLVGLPGCGGCKPEDPVTKKKREEEEAKAKKQKEKDKPKADFEFETLKTLPHDSAVNVKDLSMAKPGHWVTAAQFAKANNFDFQADSESQLLDTNGKQMDVERTPFQITLSRPAVLPKGQIKNFEIVVPMARPPKSDAIESRAVRLKSTLFASRGGKSVEAESQTISAMPEHQFNFVVLARDPDNYAFLKRTASVFPPAEDRGDGSQRAHYRVLLPKIGDGLPVPIPTHPLTWSSIAYVLWDGALPNRISPDQQQAILDWIHWGGQLVISGPHSLDDLKGSFLEPYLPAEKVRSVEYTNSDLDELNENWSVPSVRHKDPQRLVVAKRLPLVGVELKPHPEATFLPRTGKLAIERRVGAGRIVVTAISLDDSRVATWKSFDNFLNACLLRRPGREFRQHNKGLYVEFNWRTLGQASTYDPRLNSTLRYFTRDVGYETVAREREVYDQLSPPDPAAPERRPWFPGQSSEAAARNFGSHPYQDDWHFNGYSHAPDAGVAGWNDFSGSAEAARESLKDAAGISVPEASFVFRVMWIYLLVLVPANWLVFWLLGRVEWAWVAAPVIAVVGAVMVVRAAQLDIGFVRSRTELAVLEMQGNYNRAHLTRYTALYTSLSTAYTVGFEDESSLALPFSVNPTYQRRISESPRHVTFRRDRTSRLKDFQVDSNSTSMLHAEQMMKPGGQFSLKGNENDGWQFHNDTDIGLLGVGLLRRDLNGDLARCWLGSVPAKTTVRVRFVPANENQKFFAEWDASPITSREGKSKGEVNLAGVMSLAANRLYLNRGDSRLIAYCDEKSQKTGDISITPSVAQTLVRMLVLCHLQRGPLPAPESDKNSKRDFELDQQAGDSNSPPNDNSNDAPKPQAKPAVTSETTTDSNAAAPLDAKTPSEAPQATP